MTDEFPPFYTYDPKPATAPQRRNFVIAAMQKYDEAIAEGSAPTVQFFMLEEVSAYMRTPVSSIRQWIRDGKLPSVRPGRRRLVRVGDLKKFLESQ
jgi:excisionase family DNA binding protein